MPLRNIVARPLRSGHNEQTKIDTQAKARVGSGCPLHSPACPFVAGEEKTGKSPCEACGKAVSQPGGQPTRGATDSQTINEGKIADQGKVGDQGKVAKEIAHQGKSAKEKLVPMIEVERRQARSLLKYQ